MDLSNKSAPRADDAVLGGNTPPPINAAVLGGIEGVKRRLNSGIELQQLAALKDALNYGRAGLDLLIDTSVLSRDSKIRRAATSLILRRDLKETLKVRQDINPVSLFQCLSVLRSDAYAINAIALAPDASFVVAADTRCSIELIDLENQGVSILGHHKSKINSLAISRGGQILVSGSHDSVVKIWDLDSKRCLRYLEDHQAPVTSVDISSDSSKIVSAGRDRMIKVWDVVTGQLENNMRSISGEAFCVTFSPNGKEVAYGSEDNLMAVWEINGSTPSQTLTEYSRPTKDVCAVAFSPNQKTLIDANNEGAIRVWNFETGELLMTIINSDVTSFSAAIAPDNKTLAITAGNHIDFYNLETGEHIKRLEGHTQVIRSLSFSADGLTLASGSWDGTVRIWGISF